MQPGDIVIYKADPLLYGRMLLLEVTEDNRIRCEAIRADRDGTYPREVFGAHEFELHAQAKATA